MPVKDPAIRIPTWLSVVVILGLCLVFLVSGAEDRAPLPDAAAPAADASPPVKAAGYEADPEASAPAGDDETGWHTLSDNWTGCRSQDAQDKLVSLAASGDRPAYQAYFIQLGLSGECELIEKGTEVHLDDVTWSGLVCLRPRGNVACLWVLREAVFG